MTLTAPPESASFLNQPVETQLNQLAADFVILGAPFGIPYDMRNLASAASLAPTAVRQRSERYGAMRHHYDFDTANEMLPGGLRIVDAGDVISDPRDLPGNARRTTQAVATVVRRGAIPIVLGGDDSIPALVIAGYEGEESLTVVQIDAHLDFRDKVKGIRHGYSSPMRRASEMPWVEKIVHVGTRGVGSARRQDVEDTRARGNAIITAREIMERGIEAALQEVPEGGRYFLTIDCDGFDPSVMPGTSAAVPGGINYLHGADLITGLARRGRIVGMDYAEYYPSLDVNGLTALGLVRLIVTLMAASAGS